MYLFYTFKWRGSYLVEVCSKCDGFIQEIIHPYVHLWHKVQFAEYWNTQREKQATWIITYLFQSCPKKYKEKMLIKNHKTYNILFSKHLLSTNQESLCTHYKTPPMRNLCLELCHVYVPEWRPRQECFFPWLLYHWTRFKTKVPEWRCFWVCCRNP